MHPVEIKSGFAPLWLIWCTVYWIFILYYSFGLLLGLCYCCPVFNILFCRGIFMFWLTFFFVNYVLVNYFVAWHSFHLMKIEILSKTKEKKEAYESLHLEYLNLHIFRNKYFISVANRQNKIIGHYSNWSSHQIYISSIKSKFECIVYFYFQTLIINVEIINECEETDYE